MSKSKDASRVQVRSVAVCTDCLGSAPVRSRAEADLWLRAHDCPAATRIES